jgi:hypothetical protein
MCERILCYDGKIGVLRAKSFEERNDAFVKQLSRPTDSKLSCDMTV